MFNYIFKSHLMKKILFSLTLCLLIGHSAFAGILRVDSVVSRLDSNINYFWDYQAGVLKPLDKKVYGYNSDGQQSVYWYYGWNDVLNRWANRAKYLTSFDANGNPALTIGYEGDYFEGGDSDVWDLHAKTERIYNQDNKLIDSRTYYWNDTTHAWTPGEGGTTSFDSNGYPVEIIHYVGQASDSSWLPLNKFVKAHTAQGLLLDDAVYRWSTTLNDWVPGTRTTQTYTVSGELVEWITYTGEANTWMPVQKVFSSYDLADRLTETLAYVWDESVGDWLFVSKYEQLYDPAGNITAYKNYDWNTSSVDWRPTYLYSFTYDASNRVLESINYTWDTLTSSWEPFDQRQVCVYDDVSHTTDCSSYYWTQPDEIWRPIIRYLRGYDSDGNESYRVSFQGDDITLGWVRMDSTFSTYTATGKFISTVTYRWTVASQSWIPIGNRTVEYSANALETTEIFFLWDTATQNFLPLNKTFEAYLPDGRRTHLQSFTWDTATQSWIPGSDVQNRYNADGNLVQKFISLWDTASGAWQRHSQHDYYWSGDSALSSLDPEQISSIKLYPNPAIREITFEYTLPTTVSLSLSLYDLQGRCVHRWYGAKVQMAGFHQELLALPEGLPAGRYFLHMSGGDVQQGIGLEVR
ncbi:MAG: T9SS type A sorting domain-containing protein [Bacteroidia bacterium]|nr:T9SS type A sorting domain-containing protein [Bacteroidia bacterium]